MQLTAKRRRKDYKSDRTYLKAVFEYNRKKISKNIATAWVRVGASDILGATNVQMLSDDEIENLRKDKRIIYNAFKKIIEEKKQYTNPKTQQKYTTEEALKIEARSKDLNRTWSTGDVYARHLHKLITRDDNIKELFYQHEGIKKIDYSQYNFLGYYYYDGKEQAVYNYGDSYFLEAKSPKEGLGASLTYISGHNWQRQLDTGNIVFKEARRKR